MFMNIDPANGLAIYDQIVRQMKFAVANESVVPGELAPSVRELAKDLAVNPNTVARAYRELQAQGILAPVRGTGLEVTTQAPKRCRQEWSSLIRTRLRSVLEEARHSRMEPAEMRALLEEELTRLEKGKSK